ncbi:helix-turn-helix domain-containing protein [Streptomyces anulatus]|uniref:helix-turn-helix domain-containing protein n=1 Tax=Streptomyces anulatus TaxID=1892 RepID=UPI0036B80225
MENPGRGVPFSVRQLAEAVGLAPATVGHLVSGRMTTCDMEAAHALSEALGVAVLVLFAPPSSPNPNISAPGDSPDAVETRRDDPCELARAPHPA